MTIVRLNSAEAARLLLADFRHMRDVKVELLAYDQVLVALRGRRREAESLEVVLRLRAWEAAQRASGRDVTLELEDA